jgi:hypothetical protein
MRKVILISSNTDEPLRLLETDTMVTSHIRGKWTLHTTSQVCTFYALSGLPEIASYSMKHSMGSLISCQLSFVMGGSRKILHLSTPLTWHVDREIYQEFDG